MSVYVHPNGFKGKKNVLNISNKTNLKKAE